MKIKPVEEIKKLCEETAEPLGLKIYDVDFKQGKNPTLTVFIEKEGGVTLDDCEAFHNAVFEPLDELDPTFGAAYTFNVSSPGADRAFKTEEDFLSHVGKRVEVKLYASIKGKKFYDGVLKKYDGTSVVIEVNDKLTLSVDMKNVVKVNEYIDFN